MAVSFTRFTWLNLWGGRKGKDPVSNGSSSLNSSSDLGLDFREPETVKFQRKLSPSKKVKRKLQREEEKRNDGEFDVVVPSDGVCLSGSESDGPEWSIGWVEPHGPGFQSKDEVDGGFAVLVPCYRTGCKGVAEGSSNQLLSAIENLPNGFSSDGKNYIEKWLSSLPNF
ncbi:uncharacterized protein LOC110814411 [Carica papaya]|uniref:uncharacterized protein LOC110814411 n=1 Tax=Carica papaya TaxID=3649 RepID=UPI000B8C7747|nr:uncharacterized protein LOC110814411 [Carica papaya]